MTLNPYWRLFSSLTDLTDALLVSEIIVFDDDSEDASDEVDGCELLEVSEDETN